MQSPQSQHDPVFQPGLSKHLPPPTLTFTLPSLNDGTLLSCRVYHPVSLAYPITSSTAEGCSSWSKQKRGAILAHPYAPLGGCQDDHVVDAVGGLLLDAGFVVGTFDFRGAGASQGRSSWTGKGEAADYASFAAFLTCYVHFLDDTPEYSTVEAQQSSVECRAPMILMGGYSFGAIVATMVPTLDAICYLLETPAADSHAAQIRLRAEALGHQQSAILKAATARAGGHSRHRSSTGTRVGGEEHRGGSKTSSHSRSHSWNKTNHQTEEKLRTRAQSLLNRSRQKFPAQASTQLPPIPKFQIPKPSYLLVSRPQGVIAHLLTFSLLPSAISRPRRSQEEETAEKKLVENPTLLIYGDEDGFTSPGKQKEYVKRLQALTPKGKLRGRLVEHAGHFWMEEGALSRLGIAVDEFLQEITTPDERSPRVT